MARRDPAVRPLWHGRSLHPALQSVANAIVRELRADGIPARITSGYRSLAKQRKLYAAYKRGGPLAAAPGRSAHNFGLAVDIAISGATRSDSRYRTMHRLARRMGLETLAGAQLSTDPYHLQVPDWATWVKRPR